MLGKHIHSHTVIQCCWELKSKQKKKTLICEIVNKQKKNRFYYMPFSVQWLQRFVTHLYLHTHYHAIKCTGTETSKVECIAGLFGKTNTDKRKRW